MEQVESSVSYEKACRLCLSTSGETQPIFSSGSEDQTGSPLLVEKIQECVAVEINEEDGLPTQICTKCTSNVNNWHIFKRLCNYSQEKLKHWLNGDIPEETEFNEESAQDGENEDMMIDASYPEVQLMEKDEESKLQPEGPPILASLGLAPRNEKEDGEEEEGEGEETEASPKVEVVRRTVKKTFRPNRPLPAMQMASISCLVCERTYRYSHNARRHELLAHNYDRYSNRIMSNSKAFSKLKPNPFNLKARMMQNPAGQKSAPKGGNKGEPYPVRIRSLVDMQNNRQPEILKSLLTRKPELVVTEPEIMRSGSASPETLISEPELAAYHVETIISEPDAFGNNSDGSDNERGEDQTYPNSTAEGDSEEEGENSNNEEGNSKVNGQGSRGKGRKGSAEHITPDEQENYQSGDEGADMDDQYEDDERPEDGDGEATKDDNTMDEEGMEHSQEDEGETYNEIDVEEHELDEGHGGNYYDEDDDMPPVPLAPIVEINEGERPDMDGINDEGDEEQQEMEAEDMEHSLEPPPLTMTPAQKSFILKYRDVIEQVNTLKCKCCDKVHPRRKAVIQHLQKTGQKVPKHTCYNCCITFGHIGALLSHMRANVCTNLWRIIFEEGGIPDEMVCENAYVPESKGFEGGVREDVSLKSQYKDILNARSYACKLCNAKYQLKQMIMKHIIDVHENGGQRVPLCCIHCKYRFKDNKVWKKHIRNGECSVYISCDMCNEKFRSLLQFTEHALSLHSGGSLDQSAEGLSKSVDGRPTDCHICQKSHSSYHTLVKHLKTVHNEERPHMCQHCDSKFADVTDLNNHIYSEHSDRTNGDRSGELDPSQVDLSIVKQEEVTTYNYSCTDCEAIFDSVDGWTQHQIDVHNHTAYECDLCDKKYLQDSELEEHKNEHLKVRFYSCTLCSNSYNSAQSLSEHMLNSHHGETVGENPFFCEMCSRSFKNRQAFSNHMRIHTNIPTHNKRPGEVVPQTKKVPQPKFFNMMQRNSPKSLLAAPYACDICGKGFLHKKNIWKHKKVLHPEEARRIELEKTGAHFLNNSLDMQTSQNSDSTGLSIPQFDSFTTAVYEQPVQEYHAPVVAAVPEERPVYQCDLCDKKFSVKSSIWKHKRVKHGIVNPQIQLDSSGNVETPKISCSLCKINFSDKESYQRHKKTVHSVGCKICGQAMSSTLQLYQHYKAAHAKELLGYNASQGDEVEESREASDEGEETYFDEDGENPESKYQARYPCGDCGRTFVGMTALQEHDCQDGSSSQTFDCEICNKSYTSISALKSHRGWHLRSPDGKAAMNSSGLWMPQKQPTKVSKFEVRDGPMKHSTPMMDHLEIKRKLPPDVQMTLLKKKKLNDEVTLALVQDRRAMDDNRTCEPCGKQFCSKAGFLRHMEEVHQPNSIFCPLCSKSFTRKSTLLIHMRKHGIISDGTGSGESGGEGAPPVVKKETERLYACDMCNVKYTTSKSLRRHRLKHHSGGQGGLEIRPSAGSIVGTRVVEVGGPSRHKCDQCGDSFLTEKDMWQHPHYSCEQCPMMFSKQQQLNSHMRSKHPESVPGQFFPCSMCDRFYTNKKSLQQHIENAH